MAIEKFTTNFNRPVSILPAICFSLILFFSFCLHRKTSNFNSTEIITLKEDTANSIDVKNTQSYTLKTYQVTDSAGKLQGWGYDVYVDFQKAIHQPVIPGIPGNNFFKTEPEARIIGDFVINKMKITGTLPSVNIEELDSLGIAR